MKTSPLVVSIEKFMVANKIVGCVEWFEWLNINPFSARQRVHVMIVIIWCCVPFGENMVCAFNVICKLTMYKNQAPLQIYFYGFKKKIYFFSTK